MKAHQLYKERKTITDNSFAELVVWQVERPLLGSDHLFKYRLAFVVGGVCMIRYDNEAGKGDHKHMGSIEVPYTFTSPAQLVEDFWHDVNHWRP